MTTPPRFTDPATLPPFPARPSVVPRQSAGLIGLWVFFAVTAAGAVLGPVVAAVAFHLSPLHPVTVVGGAAVGATYGLALGVLAGAVTAVGVALARSNGPAR